MKFGKPYVLAAALIISHNVMAQKAFWDYHADATTQEGFIIQGKNMPENIDDLVHRAWVEAQECSGITATPKHRVIVNFTGKLKKRNNEGTIYLTRSTVYIEANKRDMRYKPMSTVKHEFIHYLKYLDGNSLNASFKKHGRIYKKCSKPVKL